MARPEWVITPEIIEKARDLASKGLTKKNIADCFGINESTLYEKIQKSEEFSKALAEGKGEIVQKITEQFMKHAIDEKDLKAQMFFLTRRAGWTEPKHEVIEEKAPDGSTKQLTIIRSRQADDPVDSK